MPVAGAPVESREAMVRSALEDMAWKMAVKRTPAVQFMPNGASGGSFTSIYMCLFCIKNAHLCSPQEHCVLPN